MAMKKTIFLVTAGFITAAADVLTWFVASTTGPFHEQNPLARIAIQEGGIVGVTVFKLAGCLVCLFAIAVLRRIGYRRLSWLALGYFVLDGAIGAYSNVSVMVAR